MAISDVGPPAAGRVGRADRHCVSGGPGAAALPVTVEELWAEPMELALAEALASEASGDVPVGAVVLSRDGSLLSVGRNVRERDADPAGHAEVVALRRAAAVRGAWRLDGCTLVVTLEPCTMCAGAAVLARVARIVFGAWDPKAGACGSLWDVVRDRRLNHRPEVVAGVRAERCSSLLARHFEEQHRVR